MIIALVRAELRSHTGVIDEMRQGFATVNGGMAQIVTLLEGISRT